MRYYYIYSAGGGAGDWNGVKRVFRTKMPVLLKKNILLKFGDLYFNHASSNELIKSNLLKNTRNIRNWLFTGVNDSFVLTESDILLDSGSSKIVNFIITKNPNCTPQFLLEKFDSYITEYNLIENHIDIINFSNVNEFVTFDVPNPFKLRTENVNTSIHILTGKTLPLELDLCAKYANKSFELMGKDQKKILTTINGLWDIDDIKYFLSKLMYTPRNVAIGGLTRVKNSEIDSVLRKLDSILDLNNCRVHFLGCGGIDKAGLIKNYINGNNISVDNSTPMNRAIDGNTSGTSLSGYFDYNEKKLIRIKNTRSVDEIIKLHRANLSPGINEIDMEYILNQILNHQNGMSSIETYNARAILAFHNHDVFRFNAI